MKYFILAGEASGDMHASLLMKGIKEVDVDASFCYWGGELMEGVAQGLKKHYRDLAFMGFAEVIKNIGTITKYFAECKQEIKGFSPEAVIFVDYPGFNLRMAKWCKSQGYLTFYFISPQVWAWKSKRVESVRKYIDKMFVILPFEKPYYEQRGVQVSYYGHPLVEVVDNYLAGSEQVHIGNKVALLPGSRKQEISRILPVMVDASRKFPNFSFQIAKARAIEESFYKEFYSGHENISLHTSGSYDLLSTSIAALVTSGTATLETALFGVPQVVCYKGSGISYQIAKSLVKIEFISLVNLIAGRAVVTELIQNECTTKRVAEELGLIGQMNHRNNILEGYEEIRQKLRIDQAESVGLGIAREIWAYLSESRA